MPESQRLSQIAAQWRLVRGTAAATVYEQQAASQQAAQMETDCDDIGARSNRITAKIIKLVCQLLLTLIYKSMYNKK